MICKVYKPGTLKKYCYVVILSEYLGKILLSRHRERTTWEAQGGHIEPGERPLEAAKRELYEESGTGMVFRAQIHKLDPLPESEMEEVKLFDDLPENLTYPEILSCLYEYMNQ